MSYLIRRVLAKPRLILDEMCHSYGKFAFYLRRVLILCHLRRKNSLGHFFFWRETEILFVTKIFAANGLRSQVTIKLRDYNAMT